MLNLNNFIQMGKLKMWLYSAEGQKQVPANELAPIVNRLDTLEVSIKAFNTFPITFSTLVHVRRVLSFLVY